MKVRLKVIPLPETGPRVLDVEATVDVDAIVDALDEAEKSRLTLRLLAAVYNNQLSKDMPGVEWFHLSTKAKLAAIRKVSMAIRDTYHHRIDGYDLDLSIEDQQLLGFDVRREDE